MTTSIKSQVPWGRIALNASPIDLEDFDEIGRFLERKNSQALSPNTLRSYQTDLTLARDFIGRSLLMASEQDLETFLVAEANRGMQADTVARRLNSLRSFYKDARHQRLIPENPTDRIPSPKRPKRLGRYLKEAERTRLLANLPRQTRNDKRKAAIVASFCHAGLRLAELAALNIEDIGEDNLRVHGKGRVQREVPIGQQLRLVLNAWLAVHPAREGALFTSLGDQPGRLSHCQLRSIVKQVFKDLGLSDRRYTPLTLRHTFATRLVKKGAPIQQVQRLLGHANINTTLVYIHTRFDSNLIDLMDD